MSPRRHKRLRTGGIYIAVLGTALIVALLGMSALIGQRLQNRMVVASAAIRQAQLNANTAIELGLLAMKSDTNWRTTYANETFFVNRGTNAGTCTLYVGNVTDPIGAAGNTATLSSNPDSPVVMLGIGYSGEAVQRFEVTIDPRRDPKDVLNSNASAGGMLAGQSSSVDWSSVISTYSSLATPITYASLPTADQFEFGRNISFNSNLDDWNGQPPGLPQASLNGPVSFSGRSACVRVSRSDKKAGVGNSLQVGLLKPNTSYQVSIEVHPNLSLLQSNWFKVFMITEYANGTFVESPGSMTQLSYLTDNVWNTLPASITTPAWTEEPKNVYLVVNSDRSGGQVYTFYVDNLHIYENTTGRYLFEQALGPTVANPNGIYKIDCGGGKLLIERSRILGTLVVINPGTNSAIANGPANISPATPGYPSLLVQGNFAIRATNRALSEVESSMNFNPSGMPYAFNNSLVGATDSSINDIYPSEIQGLVAVSGNLTFENQPRVSGQVIVGGSVSSSPSMTLQTDSNLSPPPEFYVYRYYRRPGSGRKTVTP